MSDVNYMKGIERAFERQKKQSAPLLLLLKLLL